MVHNSYKNKLINYSKKVPKIKSFSEKIDIVYTWVNSEDKKWQNKIKQYVDEIDPVRFKQFNEIYFSLETLEKFARPIINKIYIVTDNQKIDTSKLSEWLSERVVHVFHSEIIPDKYLPTFNSLTIETFIYRIPNLTNNFLYLNDDVFLGNHLTNDFLYRNNTPNILIRIRDKPAKRSLNQPWLHYYLNVYDMFIDKYGLFPNISPLHTYVMMNVDVCKLAYKNFEKEIEASITRTRDSKNINFWFLGYAMGLYSGHFNYYLANDSVTQIIYCQTKNGINYPKMKEDIKELFRKRPITFNYNNLVEDCMPFWELIKKHYIKTFDMQMKKSK